MPIVAATEGFFLSMAQIAVAFAGFAGVIGAFNRFATDPRAVAFRIRAMVILSLHALLMSLAPFALAAFGFSSESAWRIACAYAALQASALTVVLVFQGLPIFREKLLHTAALNFFWNAIGVVVIGLLFAVASSALSATVADEVYVGAIVYVVLLCSFNFLMLILSIRFDP